MKIRLSILFGELILGVIGVLAICQGMMEVVTACVVGICALLPKLVDSEEMTERLP